MIIDVVMADRLGPDVTIDVVRVHRLSPDVIVDVVMADRLSPDVIIDVVMADCLGPDVTIDIVRAHCLGSEMTVDVVRAHRLGSDMTADVVRARRLGSGTLIDVVWGHPAGPDIPIDVARAHRGASDVVVEVGLQHRREARSAEDNEAAIAAASRRAPIRFRRPNLTVLPGILCAAPGSRKGPKTQWGRPHFSAPLRLGARICPMDTREPSGGVTSRSRRLRKPNPSAETELVPGGFRSAEPGFVRPGTETTR